MEILIIATVIIVYGMHKHYVRRHQDNMDRYPESKYFKRRYGFSDRINQINWLR